MSSCATARLKLFSNDQAAHTKSLSALPKELMENLLITIEIFLKSLLILFAKVILRANLICYFARSER